MTVRRDTRAKESVPVAELGTRLPAMLADVQRTMFEQAKAFREENTVLAQTKEEVIAHFNSEKRGFVAVPWDGTAAFEAEIKEKAGATMRCMPIDDSRFESLRKPGHRVALFARAY
jgi:prolyl-tRNA synthetase